MKETPERSRFEKRSHKPETRDNPPGFPEYEDIAEYVKHFMEDTIKGVSFGIGMVDNMGEMVFANNAFMSMLGYESEDLLGFHYTKILYPGNEPMMGDQLAARSEGKAGSYEIDLKHKNGRRVSSIINGWPVYEKGEYAGSIGFFIDITDRKRAEDIQNFLFEISKAVNSSKDLWELLEIIQASLNKIINAKNFSVVLYDNKNDIGTFFYRMDKEVYNQSTYPDLSKTGSLASIIINEKKPLIKREQEIRDIYRFVNNRLPLEIPKVHMGVPLLLNDEIIGIVSLRSYSNPDCYTEKDIELLESVSDQIAIAIDRKQRQDKLLESENRFRAIFDNSLDAILLSDCEGKIYAANNAAAGMFGKTVAEIYSSGRDALMDTNDPNFQLFIRAINETGQYKGELNFIKNDGSIFPCELTAVTFRNRLDDKRLSITIKDISERKNAELTLKNAHKDLEEKVKQQTAALIEANSKLQNEIHDREKAQIILKRSEEKFSKAFRSSPLLMTISEIWDGRFIDVNDAFLDFHGVKREDVIGCTSLELGFTSPRMRESMKKIIEKEGTVKNYVQPLYTIDGEERVGSFSIEIINIDGKPCLLTVVDDITEQKKMENALKESEERYKAIFEKAPVAVTLATYDGKPIAFNQTMIQLTGYSREELEKLPLSNLYQDPEDRMKIVEEIKRSGAVYNYPARIKVKNDEPREALLTMSKIHDSKEGKLLQTIAIDITDRRRIEKEKEKLEASLQQARKMEAIASLAGGIAHQFNNSLSLIVGNLELLKMELSKNDKINRYIDPMKNSVFRMCNLTDQLLAYARGGKYNPLMISINDFLRDTLSLLEHNIPPEVRLETDIPNDLFCIKADLTQMQMMISAIISNASEAIDENGRIRISCSNKKITGDTTGDPDGIIPGQYVLFTIEDDGKGMAGEIKDRVFDPFFSTKLHGRGLGMAAAYGIVQSHDGRIFIESIPDKGTKIDIYLPAFSPDSETGEGPAGKPEKFSKTALIIEDEETVREVCQGMLEKLGYRVMIAETGHKALDIAKSSHTKIDIALLDIGLPDMEGKAIYPLIKEARPDIKTIVCSGFDLDGQAHEILKSGAEAFIQKPFTMDTLATKLSEVMD